MALDDFYKTVSDRDYIKDLPDDALKDGISSVLENYPAHFLSVEQFKQLVRFQSEPSSLTTTTQRYRPFGMAFDPDPLDQFVAASMKRYDRRLYDSLKGKTKLPKLGRCLFSLLKFAKPLKTSQAIREYPGGFDCYQKSLQEVRQLFKGKKFATLPLSDMHKQIPLNTAAGVPYFAKKQDVLEENKLATIRNYIHLTTGKKIEQAPCMLGVRGHLSDLSLIKTRPIWINSFDNITLENILFRNIYSFTFSDPDFQKLLLTGPSTIRRLRDFLSLPHSFPFVNLDFSSFDSWSCRFAGRDILMVLKEVIDFKDGEEGVFNYVCKQFLDSILVLPDGSAVQKHSGTCTGSLLTALFNSLLNFVVLKTCFKILAQDRLVFNLRILGDDAAFYCGFDDLHGFLARLSRLCSDLFGLTLNPDKCIVTAAHEPVEHRKFIGYQIRGSQLYRPVREFFYSVLYAEHSVNDLSTSFSRVIAYYLLGGMAHPQFTSFVEAYLGHYYDHLSVAGNLLDESVFRAGNLRVIKHVFQLQVEDLIGDGLTVDKFRTWDILDLAYRFTLGDRLPYG